MKIKRALPLILSLFMIGGVFAGCTKKDKDNTNDTDNTEQDGNKPGEETPKPEHEHTWSKSFSYENEDGHYIVTTCTGHEQVKGQLIAHNYDGNYVCMSCGYEHQHVWTEGNVYKNGTGHYIATTCLSHRIIKKDQSAHVYDNDEDTTCNGCSYVRVPAHIHTWSTKVNNAEEKGHYKMATCAGHEDQQSDYLDHEFAAGSNACACGYTREVDTSTALETGKTIYVVGDSTVCSFTDNYYLPRYGYGTQLAKYLNVKESQIVNLALSGRSAKSFLTDTSGNYTTLTENIGEGDYLIIGFGHNDEKSDDSSRFSSATGDKDTEGSFQNVLYKNYVKLAKDKGATPILCTPITRYDSSGKYEGAKVHVTADGDYPQAIKDLGAATDTTVIDLTKLTSDLYKSDNANAQYFHAHTSCEGEEVKMPTGRDDTHINKYGAEMVCYLFANALRTTGNPLAAQVITNKLAPAKGTHLPAAVKADYVAPNYEEFDPEDYKALKLTDDGWYKTIMGNLGGASKISNFKVQYADSKFTVGNDGPICSKIDATSDGFAAAFMQVDVRKNFTASAKVTVKKVDAGLTNAQGGFGLMLRDDILVNINNASLATNYVAAGLLNTKAPIFSRADGALSLGGSSAAIQEGDTHTMSITRVGQVVTVKFDSTEKTFTDFDFVAIDGDYMYLCLFANRGVVAEFTDVKFEITGNAQGA